MVAVWSFVAICAAAALLFGVAWLAHDAWAPALFTAAAFLVCRWCYRKVDRS